MLRSQHDTRHLARAGIKTSTSRFGHKSQDFTLYSLFTIYDGDWAAAENSSMDLVCRLRVRAQHFSFDFIAYHFSSSGCNASEKER